MNLREQAQLEIGSNTMCDMQDQQIRFNEKGKKHG